MLNKVRSYAPDTWSHTADNKSDVASYSEEYKQIEYEVRRAANNDGSSIRRMIRVQDLYAFGQFLIREQLLINLNSSQLYRVRRYIQVSRTFLDDIIKYNLDPRRCDLGQSLTFRKKLSWVSSGSLVVVVKVLTTEPEQDVIVPNTSCDYFVEYIVEL